MRIIGHGPITTTTKIYGHLRPTALDDARERINRALENA